MYNINVIFSYRCPGDSVVFHSATNWRLILPLPTLGFQWVIKQTWLWEASHPIIRCISSGSTVEGTQIVHFGSVLLPHWSNSCIHVKSQMVWRKKIKSANLNRKIFQMFSKAFALEMEIIQSTVIKKKIDAKFISLLIEYFTMAMKMYAFWCFPKYPKSEVAMLPHKVLIVLELPLVLFVHALQAAEKGLILSCKRGVSHCGFWGASGVEGCQVGGSGGHMVGYISWWQYGRKNGYESIHSNSLDIYIFIKSHAFVKYSAFYRQAVMKKYRWMEWFWSRQKIQTSHSFCSSHFFSHLLLLFLLIPRTFLLLPPFHLLFQSLFSSSASSFAIFLLFFILSLPMSLSASFSSKPPFLFKASLFFESSLIQSSSIHLQI